jgi:hypothetical protein
VDGEDAGGDQQGQHWRERAAARQRYWSLSHGFQMGRKLAAWGEEDGQQQGATAPGQPEQEGEQEGEEEPPAGGTDQSAHRKAQFRGEHVYWYSPLTQLSLPPPSAHVPGRLTTLR